MTRYIVRRMVGMAPGISDQEIPPTHAVLAENIELSKRGSIRSRRGFQKAFSGLSNNTVFAISRVYFSANVIDYLALTQDAVIGQNTTAPEKGDASNALIRSKYFPINNTLNTVNQFSRTGQASFNASEFVGFAIPATTNTSAVFGTMKTWFYTSDPASAAISDDAYATLNVPQALQQSSVSIDSYGFDGKVPLDAEIQGMEIFVEGLLSSASPSSHTLQVYISTVLGSVAGTPADVTFTGTEATKTYGSSTDLWGFTTATLTASVVRQNNFGCKVIFYPGGGANLQCQVDSMSMKVYYSSNQGPNLTKNIVAGDSFDSDSSLLPNAGPIKTVTSDSVVEFFDTAAQSGTSTSTFFHRVMNNQFGSGFVQIPGKNRVYVFNGNDTPWEYSLTDGSFGKLGNPAPTETLSLATASGTNVIPPGDYKYIETIASELGESNAGPSTSVTVAASSDVSVTNIGLAHDKATERRLWRTADSGVQYYLLTTIEDNTTTTYTDTKTDASLIASTAFDTGDRSMPQEWRIMVWHHNRMWGFIEDDNRIYYTNLDAPDEWPALNFIRTSNGDIVRNILPLGEALVVYTNKSIEPISGRTADTFTMRPAETKVAIYAPFTLTAIEKSQHIFLARDGLRIFNGAASAPVINDDFDIVFNPDSIPQGDTDFRMEKSNVKNCFGIFWEKKYFLFYPSTGNIYSDRVLIYNFEEQSVHLIRHFQYRFDDQGNATDGTLDTYCATVWDGPNDQNSLHIGTDGGIFLGYHNHKYRDNENGAGIEGNIPAIFNTKHLDCDFKGDKIFKAIHVIAEATDGQLKLDLVVDRQPIEVNFSHSFQDTGQAERIMFPMPNDVKGQEIQLKFEYFGSEKMVLEGFDVDYDPSEFPLDGVKI